MEHEGVQRQKFNNCAVFTGANFMHRIKGTGQSASQAPVTAMRLQWLPALLLSGSEVLGMDFRDTLAYDNVYQWTADETRRALW